MRKPRVLIVTPEITELPEGMGDLAGKIQFKVGGLADIQASLIGEMYKGDDIDLHVAMPKWRTSLVELSCLTEKEYHQIDRTLRSHQVHLIEDSSFNNVEIQGTNTMIYSPDRVFNAVDRALAFQRGVLNYTINHINPDIVWVNDWMTALIPAAVKNKGIKSLFTLHNIFTEYVTLQKIYKAGIDVTQFKENLYLQSFPKGEEEDWKENPVDMTASAIMSADYITTVSPSFLDELVTGYFPNLVPPSVRTEIIKKSDMGRAKGILNAGRVYENKSLKDITNKVEKKDLSIVDKKNWYKKHLKKEVGLKTGDFPLIFFPNRLYEQKNPKLLLENAQNLVNAYGTQIAIISNGSPEHEKAAKTLAKKSNGMISYNKFDQKLQSFADIGADFCLMTSNYEPCGMPNVTLPKIGTLMIAHSIGGIKDSVKPLDISSEKGNGFPYKTNDKEGLFGAVSEAIKFYNLSKEEKEKNLERIIKEHTRNHSVERMAKEYKDIIFDLYTDWF